MHIGYTHEMVDLITQKSLGIIALLAIEEEKESNEKSN